MGFHAEDHYSRKTLKWAEKTIKMCEGLMLISNNQPLSLYGRIELSRLNDSETFQVERVNSIGQRFSICEFSSLDAEIPEMAWLMRQLVEKAYARWKWRIDELS